MSEMRLTISDIESRQFRRAAYGYEQREVDEFLDCICDEIELLQGEIAALRRELDLSRAQTRKAQAEGGFAAPVNLGTDNACQDILESAQRVREQTIADAKRQAGEILADAQAQADAELGGLKAERERLEKLVENLRDNARSFRDKARELIRAQQEALESVSLDDEA